MKTLIMIKDSDVAVIVDRKIQAVVRQLPRFDDQSPNEFAGVVEQAMLNSFGKLVVDWMGVEKNNHNGNTFKSVVLCGDGSVKILKK